MTFKELELSDSAVIYESQLAQVKDFYKQDPQAAGELAIAILENALSGGEFSSDNWIV